MSETKVEMKIISAVSNILGNRPLEETMQRALEELGPPNFDDADRAFARKIQDTLTEQDIAAAYNAIGREPTDAPLCDFTVPLDAPRKPMIGSTDVGDVSWAVPTVQAHAPSIAIGTPLHTWQVVAQGKAPHAQKAMVQVAKAMAATAAALVSDKELLQAAKDDHAAKIRRTPYVSPIPPDVEPPLDMSTA
jgi:aminobenzoyl-glutamate utilization protein B